MTPDAAAAPSHHRRRWAHRLGAAAFLFFLIKGLAWLAVPPLLILAARILGN